MKSETGLYIRPGPFMTRIVNPIVRRFGLSPTLTVVGRRSGEPRTVPLGSPLELEGTRYLVSGRGETQWVRNLRAADRAELRIHGRSEAFHPVEIVGADRERIVGVYRQKLGRSVDRYFAEIPDPADHPVFRIEPVDAANDAPCEAGRP